MKKRILKPKGDYIFFADALNDNDIYCMTREIHKEIQPITQILKKTPDDVSGETTVKVFPLTIVEENENSAYYDITVIEPIDFKINRIKWVWVYHDPNLH